MGVRTVVEIRENPVTRAIEEVSREEISEFLIEILNDKVHGLAIGFFKSIIHYLFYWFSTPYSTLYDFKAAMLTNHEIAVEDRVCENLRIFRFPDGTPLYDLTQHRFAVSVEHGNGYVSVEANQGARNRVLFGNVPALQPEFSKGNGTQYLLTRNAGMQSYDISEKRLDEEQGLNNWLVVTHENERVATIAGRQEHVYLAEDPRARRRREPAPIGLPHFDPAAVRPLSSPADDEDLAPIDEEPARVKPGSAATRPASAQNAQQPARVRRAIEKDEPISREMQLGIAERFEAIRQKYNLPELERGANPVRVASSQGVHIFYLSKYKLEVEQVEVELSHMKDGSRVVEHQLKINVPYSKNGGIVSLSQLGAAWTMDVGDKEHGFVVVTDFVNPRKPKKLRFLVLQPGKEDREIYFTAIGTPICRAPKLEEPKKAANA